MNAWNGMGFGRRLTALLAAAALGAIVVAGPAAAQDAAYNEAPMRDDFIGALTYPQPTSGLRTKGAGRGLSLGPTAAPPPVATAAPAVETTPAAAGVPVVESAPAATESPAPSLNFKVEFALNSAALSDQAKATLDQLGSALESPQLAAYRFLILGHTDASGSAALNLDLSERRARSVRDYLTAHFGIGASRLESRGVGAARLLRPDAPYDGINRRVEISNLGPAGG